jgi:hypothetical protein
MSSPTEETYIWRGGHTTKPHQVELGGLSNSQRAPILNYV